MSQSPVKLQMLHVHSLGAPQHPLHILLLDETLDDLFFIERAIFSLESSRNSSYCSLAEYSIEYWAELIGGVIEFNTLQATTYHTCALRNSYV